MKMHAQDASLSAVLTKLLVVVVIGSGLAGCSGRPATAQVRGHVTFKDGSIPEGEVCVVRFEPTSDSAAPIKKAASGEIARDGSFLMYTRKPGDGVFLGSYAVTFSVWKDRFKPESLIAEKYTNASMTPYKIDVQQDVNDLTFEIEPAEPVASEATQAPEDAATQPPSGGAVEPKAEDAVEPKSSGAQEPSNN